MNRMMSFLAGAMCGALVGAVAALLLAPMSGRQLQTDARSQFDSVVADARSAAEARRTQLQNQLAAFRAPRPSEAPAAE